ncbi:MOSC domain-containing protein [Bradyrhizobium sp. WSM1253]|uniref:MOSC domain-containing protein n=1 Tax=Bradyrhizobium sp. WSM1253 TaxID=319003 RepID=UPI00025D255D|nr:MOSC domain-containing protein [Bradyrhizobium sp. WSM1253]EIG62264.1 putative Fe-S protein [Bradyrhizobium sp. WSM1253]
MIHSGPTIQAIYRYPVKGLSPESRARTVLSAGEPLPGDRSYAIENGPSGFDSAAPAHLPKSRFLMLMQSDRLGALQTRFDETTHVLTVYVEGSKAVSESLRTAEGRAAIENFIAGHCGDELRGQPKLLHARGHSFSDTADKVISFINVASVAALEQAVGARVNPLRFRGNIHVAGWPAWLEFDLLGQEIAIGDSARVKITRRITRCAATEVDPDSGVRNLDIPRALMRAYGNIDFGAYGTVIEGGEITVGDSIKALAMSSHL